MNLMQLLPFDYTDPLADPAEVRLAMRRWSSGVTVVTSQHEGLFHGMTVSSFTSLALNPPTVLVALEQTTRTHHLIQLSGFFAVTILAEGQEWISDRFAGRAGHEDDRFAGVATDLLASGAPLIRGGLAYFDCQVVGAQPVGHSTIFFGQVLETRVFPGQPLVYHSQAYHSLQK